MTADERIDDLEYRLEQYHEWLVDSIAQRDRLAIDAAWGVHYAFSATLWTIGLIFAVHYFVGDTGWLPGSLKVAAFVIAPIVVHMWSNGKRMAEVDRFAKLPDWKAKTG